MAAQFCSGCGTALPEGAQFCAACGAPVPAGTGPSPTSTAIPAPADASAGADRPIAELLGVQTTRQFRIHHLVDGPRHAYRVTNMAGVALFNVGPPASEEHRARWQRARPNRPPGLTLGGLHVGPAEPSHGPPIRRQEWGIDDFAGNLRADLFLLEQPPFWTAELTSVAGRPILSVHVAQKLTKREFKVTSPDGALLLETRDSVHSSQFALHDAMGGAAAWVHAETEAGRHAAYRVEIVGSTDPVAVTVFAILIDVFKGAK